MALAAAAALIEDHLMDAGMWRSLGRSGNYLGELIGRSGAYPVNSPGQIGHYLWFAGLAGFVIICVFAGGSGHRGFSHSLIALVLETFCLWLIFPAVAMPFAIAFISHVLLDIMNKRSVRLFYPAKKGVRLGWFYADRLANRVFEAGGMLWLIASMILCLRS